MTPTKEDNTLKGDVKFHEKHKNFCVFRGKRNYTYVAIIRKLFDMIFLKEKMSRNIGDKN